MGEREGKNRSGKHVYIVHQFLVIVQSKSYVTGNIENNDCKGFFLFLYYNNILLNDMDIFMKPCGW